MPHCNFGSNDVDVPPVEQQRLEVKVSYIMTASLHIFSASRAKWSADNEMSGTASYHGFQDSTELPRLRECNREECSLHVESTLVNGTFLRVKPLTIETAKLQSGTKDTVYQYFSAAFSRGVIGRSNIEPGEEMLAGAG